MITIYIYIYLERNLKIHRRCVVTQNITFAKTTQNRFYRQNTQHSGKRKLRLYTSIYFFNQTVVRITIFLTVISIRNSSETAMPSFSRNSMFRIFQSNSLVVLFTNREQFVKRTVLVAPEISDTRYARVRRQFFGPSGNDALENTVAPHSSAEYK